MALLRVQTSSVKAVSFATLAARSWREVGRVSFSFWRLMREVLASSSCLVMATMLETVAHSVECMLPSPADMFHNSLE